MGCSGCQARAQSVARSIKPRGVPKPTTCIYTIEDLTNIVNTTTNMTLKTFAQSQINIYHRNCNMFADQIKYYNDIV